MSLETGIRAFYNLDEADLADRVDFFSLGPDLLQSGGVDDAVGKVGQGLAVTGGNGVFSPTDNYFDFSGANSRTLTGWVKFNSISASPGIVSNWVNGGSSGAQWLVYENGSTLALRWRTTIPAEAELTTAFGALSTGVWYFFAFWHDHTTGEFGLRVNTTVNTVINADGIVTGTAVMIIGNRNGFGAGTDGVIDSVGVWDRVLTSGELDELYNAGAGLEPPFSGATTLIDNFDLQTAGWREGKWASSVAVRSVDGTVSGYTRQSSVTKDDSSSDSPIGAANKDTDASAVRYVRNYYTLPPSTFFEYFRMRVDLNDSYRNQKEDGFRQYNRIYKHNQGHYVSGPCTVEGLIPHTFIHQESPAEDEVFTYSNAVNLNAFRLEFKWQATFGHVDVQEDLELTRLSIDSNNYIRLLIIGGDPNDRRYHSTDVCGGHDPTFRLEKVRGGSTVDSVDVVCYYGYDNRESSVEVLPDTLIFTIDHLTGPGGYLSLSIDKFKNRGRAHSTADLVAYSGNSVGSIIYNGVGYYTRPRLILSDQSHRTNGRKLPTLRNNLNLRFSDFDRSSVSVGERDPTCGQRVSDNPYDIPEVFTRANSGNLGDNWDIIQTDSDVRNAGDGFDVVSNKAQAYGSQFERWDSDPQHSNYIYKASVSVQANSDLVGLLARYLNEFFKFGGDVCGFGCELVQTGASAANIRIVAWWLSTRTVLNTGAVTGYVAGTEYEMRFTLNGSTLTGELFGLGDLITPIGTVTTTSTLFRKPGRLGIYCEAPTNFVTVDSVSVEPLFSRGFDE